MLKASADITPASGHTLDFKFIRGFSHLAAAIFIVFGLAKFVSGIGSIPILHLPDPVFGYSYRTLLISLSAIEIGLAIGLLSYGQKHSVDCLLGVLGFCAAAWIYRYELASADSTAQCPCLGFLTQNLGITPDTANRVSLWALIFLSIGSCGCLAIATVIRKRRLRACKEVAAILVLWLLAAQPLKGSTLGDEIEMGRKGLRLEGVIRWRGSPDGGPVVPTFTNNFSLLLSGGCFHLEGDGIGGVTGAPQQSFQFDGTNYYHVLTPTNVVITNFINRPGKASEVARPLKPPTSSATVTVSPTLDNIILPANILGPVWLALASKHYYEGQKSPKLAPLLPIGNADLRAAQRVLADRYFDQSRLFITSYADYFNEDLFPEPQPDCNGKTNIACWITGWTNIESVEVPTGFLYQYFFYHPVFNPRYFLRSEATGKILTAKIIAEFPSFTPVVAPNAYIVHHTAADSSMNRGPITYRTKNGVLKDQPELEAIQVQQGLKKPKLRNTRVPYIKALITLIALTGPALLLLRRLRK